ncbi:uncharacterized protein [Narcine bancroftii]|uniref:uncharacterized protein isoform X2 n=1 Tax=Narcine bancroftii TaxID=1343680 RepID=UPI00383106C1
MSRPVMETLEEFDQEYPLNKMFCKRLTKEEFETEALTCTDEALQDLFCTMDKNPSLCEKVVRRRKQAELEKAGLKSFVKAKFFSVVDGRMNRCNAVKMDELQERLQCLKDEMRKVQRYAHEAKGQRTSKRLAEKRLKKQAENSTSTGSSQPAFAATFLPPPPPPLPPPLPSFCNRPLKTPLKDKSNLHTKEQVALATPDLLESYGLARLNRRSKSIGDLRDPEGAHSLNPVRSLHSELLAANHFKRLRSTGVDRSPGGTPSKASNSKAAEGEARSPASVFNATLLDKFRNTKSPVEFAPRSPTTSDSDSSGFATPPGSP